MAMSRRELMTAIAAGALLPELLRGTNNAWAQTGSTRRSFALTIGLDFVNPRKYGNWSGILQGCVADAKAYETIAHNANFEQRIPLHNDRAEINEVARHILWAAKELREGDIFFVSYSGHGSQIVDNSGEESDNRDETWCLFDGQLRDDELYRFWQCFREGVRILVVSDSCHSGTVARVVELANAAARDAADANSVLSRTIREVNPTTGPNELDAVANRGKVVASVQARAARSREVAEENSPAFALFRAMPEAYMQAAYEARQTYYDDIARSLPTGGEKAAQDAVKASGLLLAGCQDDQLSMEVGQRGLFSSVLESSLKENPPSYSVLRDKAAAKMPATQQPNFFTFGRRNDVFYHEQRPFSV